MNPIQAIVYGIIQGLTEFLPISSNAHLRLAPLLFGWEDPGAAFTAVIQLGTTLAVLIYFAKDLALYIGAWARSLTGKGRGTPEAQMGWGVFWGTIPIVVLGLVLHEKIETTFRSLYVIGFSLIFMGLLMLVAEKVGKKNREMKDITTKDGIIVGLFQCFSLLPGMSRSGSTITGGLFQGIERSTAARFSFLLGVPSITAAGFYEFFKERKAITGELLQPVIIATIVSFVVGYASIAFLLKFLQKRGTAPFVAYRVVLGLLVLGAVATGKVDHLAGAKALKVKPSVEASAQ